MLLLNQTLTPSEKQAALRAAEVSGDDLHMINHRRPEEIQPGERPSPIVSQAIPREDSDWTLMTVRMRRRIKISRPVS